MSQISVPILKFVGTCSLGLLTVCAVHLVFLLSSYPSYRGVSYATSTQTVPSFLVLPSAGAANATYKHNQTVTARHLNGLSLLASSAYLFAYALSPGRRHPYLLWTCLTVGIGAGTDLFMSRRSGDNKKPEQTSESKVEEEDYEDVNGSVRLNGEEVRKSMEGYKLRQSIRAGISGLAFLLGVVGMWGDGRPRI